jgi:hypothetical protein
MSDESYGIQMGEIHRRYKRCEKPYLNDQECVDLRDWLKEVYEYSFAMGDHINAVYFGMEHESMSKICDARKGK